MGNAGLFYDHTRNLLFWSLNTYPSIRGPFAVLEFGLCPLFQMVAPPTVRLWPTNSPAMPYGAMLGGASVSPVTGDLYFYSLVQVSLSLPDGGTIMQDRCVVIHDDMFALF